MMFTNDKKNWIGVGRSEGIAPNWGRAHHSFQMQLQLSRPTEMSRSIRHKEIIVLSEGFGNNA